MSKKVKSVKRKVIIGYILLFFMGVSSIIFLYNEILKANKPKDKIQIQNQQLINLSDALSSLYEAESSSNNLDYITSEKGFSRYNQIIDTTIHRMQRIKVRENSDYTSKLDSITTFLKNKKRSVAKIRLLNQQYNNEVSFAKAKEKLQNTRDSLRNINKINFKKSTRSREFEELISDFLTDEQIENFNSLPVSDADLLLHYDKILTELYIREDKLKNELKEKEKGLQLENQILSTKIRILVTSIEKEVRNSSISEITQTQKDMERTTLILLWLGVIGIILLFVFGWIILRDLTRQQQYRDQLEKLNHENSTLLRSKTMLLATVTHDLQTPLGSILGFSDLLKNTNLNETQHQYINNISSSSDYILNLVNDLVDFSKLERGTIKINKVSFNPKELIENTFNTLKQKAIDKEIVLLYDIDDELNTNIISDPYRVRQILTNLIANAIKFTQRGHVKIVGKITEDNIVFSVEDTGIGITEEQQHLIFEEFTQAHSNIEEQFGGTGLGLTISKRMAKLLNGKIYVESELEKGSVFTFTIPLIKDVNETNTDISEEINTDFLKDKRILIVDDDKIQLSLMKALFLKYPVLLTTENDATKVIPLLENNDFDILFTDIQMPKKSGFVLAGKIRNHSNTNIKKLPIIALSGKRDLSLEDYIEKGFTYFIGKPMKMNEALQVLEAVFKNKKVEISEKKVVQKSDKLYDLTSLKQFISDDNEALNNIISVFLESTKTNIKELQDNSNSLEKTSETAHRMIPMLKQIESYELVSMLEKLEDKKVPKSNILTFVNTIIDQLNILTNELQNNKK